MVEAVNEAQSKLDKLLCKCRAICRLVNKSNVRMAELDNLRKSLDVDGKKRKLESDSKSRFDSSLIMLRSILAIRTLLRYLQENSSTWPGEIHLSADDFQMMKVLVEVVNL